MANNPDNTYVPAAHLTSGSLTAAQVTAQYEDFRSNLRYVSIAPELVFERIVANVCDAFKVAIEEERQQHSRDLYLSQAANDKLQAEIRELKRRVVELDNERDQLTRDMPCNNNIDDNYTPLPTLRTIPTLPMTVAKKNCPNPIVGTFDTSEIRYWFQVHAQTSKIINFPRPYSAPPGIPIGLNSIHLCKFFNVRIKSYASGIRDDRVEMHLDSWDDTYLFSAGCTWLEVEADDPDFQFGTYSTLDNQIGGQWQQKNSHQVEFARAYSAPPQVVVWLSGFDMRRGKAWKVKTYVSDVTSTGFKIHIDTWEDTVLYSGTATWVAYTAGKPGVCSGSFSTNSIIPKMSHTGYEKFGKGVFGKSPHVVVALNKIDMDCNQFMRLGVKTSDVSVDGMKWKLEGWVDTYITSAGASYISLS